MSLEEDGAQEFLSRLPHPPTGTAAKISRSPYTLWPRRPPSRNSFPAHASPARSRMERQAQRSEATRPRSRSTEGCSRDPRPRARWLMPPLAACPWAQAAEPKCTSAGEQRRPQRGRPVLGPLGVGRRRRGEQVAGAGPQGGATDWPLRLQAQTGRGWGGSWVINFNHCLEIGPPGGKSEAATCN